MEEGVKEVSPDISLEVRVDEVAAVEGTTHSGGGEVQWVFGGGGYGGGGVEPFLGGKGAEEAVGEDGGWVAFAAETGLDKATAIVENDDHVRHVSREGVRMGLVLDFMHLLGATLGLSE